MKILFRFYFVAFFLLSIYDSQAQGFKTRYIPVNSTFAHTGCLFESNNVFYFGAGIYTDTFQNKSVSKIIVNGLNPTGQVQWTKTYGDSTLQYLANTFTRKSFHKQGAFIYHSCAILQSNNKYAAAFIKFNLNGDTVWQKIYRDPDTLVLPVPQMVTSSIDGGFLITGFFESFGANPYRRCLLIKTDANGNELWRKKIGKSSPDVSDGRAIIQDSISKQIIIVGYQYLPGNKVHENILVLDSLGITLSQNHHHPNGGVFYDLIQTKDHQFLAVGEHYTGQSFGGSAVSKAYAYKFSATSPGTPIWKMVDVGPVSLINNFSNVYESNNGELILGGDLDTTQILQLPRHTMFRCVKTNSAGIMLSESLYNYSNSTQDYEQVLVSLTPGNNASMLAAFRVYQNNYNPLFYVKYDASGCDSSAAHCATLNLVGVPEKAPLSSLPELVPNPASNDVWWRHETESFIRYDQVEIYDALGNKVLSVPMDKQRVSVQHLPNGLYLVKFLEKDVLLGTKKLIMFR